MQKNFLSFFLLITFLISGCSGGGDANDKKGDIYFAALDAIMKEDKALSDHMKYIAIDLSKVTSLNGAENDKLAARFKDKYQVDVVYGTLEELAERGLVNDDANSIDGVLLRLEAVDFHWTNTVTFEGSKFKSGTGAVGVEGKVHYKGGEWKIKKVGISWIS